MYEYVLASGSPLFQSLQWAGIKEERERTRSWFLIGLKKLHKLWEVIWLSMKRSSKMYALETSTDCMHYFNQQHNKWKQNWGLSVKNINAFKRIKTRRVRQIRSVCIFIMCDRMYCNMIVFIIRSALLRMHNEPLERKGS